MYGIKNYCIEVPLNGITSIPNFMKIYQAVKKLLVGDTQTEWWFDKPTFIFWKVGLKRNSEYIISYMYVP
jgi:hypothetical protein